MNLLALGVEAAMSRFARRQDEDVPPESNDDPLYLADPHLTSALLDAVAGWSSWCHRRVDQFEPTAGNRGRLKHSIDMTLPPDARLAYDWTQRRERGASTVRGLVIAPLAVVAKEPLYEFDVELAGAGPVPLLTKAQNSSVVSAALRSAYEGLFHDLVGCPELHGAIDFLVEEQAGAAVIVAEELTRRGRYGSVQLFDPRALDPTLASLTLDLAHGFLMCALLPAETLGTRSLVKLSHLWRTDSDEQTPQNRAAQIWAWTKRVFGRYIDSVHDFELRMIAPSEASSYHLEFIVPAGVHCRYLAIPPGVEGGTRHYMLEKRDTTVHVHASYAEPPLSDAQIMVTSIGSTPRRLSYGAVAATVFICWALATWANFTQIATTGANGVGLLLSLPALLLGFAASRFGTGLADALNRPYRWLAVGCAITLFTAAAGPVFVSGAYELWTYWVWVARIASVLAGLVTFQYIWAELRLRQRIRKLRGELVVPRSIAA